MEAEWMQGRVSRAHEAAKRSLVYGRRAARPHEEACVGNVLETTLGGPIPAAEGLRSCEEFVREARGDRWLESTALCFLASHEALLGRFADARVHMGQAKVVLQELGLKQGEGIAFLYSGGVEALAGDPAAAERELRAAVEIFRDNGDRWFASFTLVGLARALYEQGRYEEARRLADAFDETPAPFDVAWRAQTRGVRARLLAREGRSLEAETLATEAAAIVAPTEVVNVRTAVLMDLAEVLLLGGDAAGAATAAGEALELYERKGNVASAARVQSFLAGLRSGAGAA